MPVIPVAVIGTDVVAPPGKKFGTFTRPRVRFGAPLDFSRYEGMEDDRYILRSITDEIMYEIMRLSGQEYVDMYASKAKDLAAKAQRGGQAGRAGGSRGRCCRGEEGLLSAGVPADSGDRGRGRPPAAVAVEDRLLRALAILRVVVLLNAIGLNLYRADNFAHPAAGVAVVVILTGWTGFAMWAYHVAARRTAWLLVADLAIAVAAILTSPAGQGRAPARHRCPASG